ncbi:MAG: Fe-S cluster assembly protein SufD [Rhizomicrobium sp.]
MGTREQIAPYLDAFHRRGAGRHEPAWLATCRNDAMECFSTLGIPTRNDESWRFGDLRPLTATAILPGAGRSDVVDAAALSAFAVPAPAHRVVLVNGRFEPSLSDMGNLPQGAWLGSTAEALTERPELVQAAFDRSDTAGAQAFASLNAGFFDDGIVLALDAGVMLERPVEILHFSYAPEALAFHMRNAIVLGAGANASVVETFVGIGAGWSNVVTGVEVGADARLQHVKIQDEAAEAFHISMLRATLAQNARVESFTATLGARLSRQDVVVDLDGEGANLAIHGVYLLRGDQEATIAPFVAHHAPNCQTNEVLKGVVDDHAHGIFLGAITVDEGADGTDARQLNRNLLLSTNARVDTKPELAILADDVKCSHGATVGDLDDASVFYLLARGIDPMTARHMLIEAFVGDVVEIAGLNGAVADHARKHISARLDRTEDA